MRFARRIGFFGAFVSCLVLAGMPLAGGQTSSRTIGQKTVLFYRIDFSDMPGEPITVASAQAMMNDVNSFYLDNSYGKMSLATTITSVLRMPQSAAWYVAQADQTNAILADVRTVALAQGYDHPVYDREIVASKAIAGLRYGATGTWGGKTIWLNGILNVRTLCHELGHNNGVMHANKWLSNSDSVIGGGSGAEYGDMYDIMGDGGVFHFNAWFKNVFNWVPSQEVQTVTASGTYRVYALEDAISNGLHALKIVKDSGRNYWVEFRQRTTTDPALMGGALLHWEYNTTASGSDLLDMTPWTSSITDAPLVIGQTLSDYDRGIHITPIGKGGTVPESLDVVVNMGMFPSNSSPSVTVNASAVNVAINQSVTFTATASDPDGDTLAYGWDLGNNAIGPNSATATQSWSVAGEYVVRCTVSDMKGGVACGSVIVRVGSPTTFRVSGRVLDSLGQPAGNARVTGSYGTLSGGLPTTVVIQTFTNSDGTYTLVGLPSANYTMAAVKWGTFFDPSGFTNALSVTADRTGINFAGRVNTAPSVPTFAPASTTTFAAAQVTSQRFFVRSTDTENQNVNYTVDWGDGTATQSGYMPAGVYVWMAKIWTTPGTYSVRVMATDNLGATSAWSSPTTITVLPMVSAPSNLTVTSVSSQGIGLSWTDNSSDEMFFCVESSTDGQAFTSTASYLSNITSATSYGYLPGSTYYLRVRAVTANGTSDPSNTVTATTPVNTAPGTPAIPGGSTNVLVGTSASYFSSATDTYGDVLSYTFDWGDGTSTISPSTTLPGQSVTLSKTWTVPGIYTVRVRARDYFGMYSAWSAGLTVTVTNTAPNVPTQPTGPASLVINQSGTFAASATDPNGHQVQYTFDWGDGTTYTTALMTSGTSGSASKSWPVAGIYSVRAMATDQYGAASGWSATLPVQVLAQLPAAPTALSAITITKTRIDLKWTDNATTEAGYKIEQSLDNVTFTQIATAVTNSTAYSVTGLNAATTYYFRMRAYNSAGDSSYSNTASTKTMSSSSVLRSISTRGYVGIGSNVMVPGFIIEGTEPKTVLIKATGPSLVDYGLTGVLADPYLQLNSGSTVIARNDNWQTSDPLMLSPILWKGTATDIQATGKQPTGTNSYRESALLVTLPPGVYTASLMGVSNGTGTGLVSVSELTGYPSSSRLRSISTRGYVGIGSNVMVPGFIIEGTEPKTVLIKATGPSLVDYGLTGVLADPYLQLNSGSTVIARNDNWQTSDPLMLSPILWKGTAADIQATGKQPTGTNSYRESAILVTLPPGVYTASLMGVSNGTGTGLVSVSEIN